MFNEKYVVNAVPISIAKFLIKPIIECPCQFFFVKRRKPDKCKKPYGLTAAETALIKKNAGYSSSQATKKRT